ncbi:hypothetical protein LMG33818_000050 [Halomonadaceae bacterium LMG 33818]|uniref:phage tail fiber protein n=1 Tax=Cernens ardua TaxID=3402176 RepID=UPI003EDBF7D4
MSGTITSADVVARITVTNLFPSGFTIQGFAADNIYDVDALTLAETVMGVDGKLSAGAVRNSINQTWHIMPDSETYERIRDWAQRSRTDTAVYRCNLEVTFRSSGQKFVHTNGVLLRSNVMPSAARTLRPIDFVIQWESITGISTAS